MKKISLFAICAILSGCSPAPLDNTDDQATAERSGFTVKIDYGTGCEYLVSRFHGGTAAVVPRISEDGRIVRGCRKPFI